MDAEEVLGALQSDPRGLVDEEARSRLDKFGYNELIGRKRASALQIFSAQFKNLFVIMLLIATTVSVLIGWYEMQAAVGPRAVIETFVDAVAIGAIVVFNAVVGFVQEYRSERAMEAMEKLTAPRARVLRNGKDRMIAAREVVPGDILVFETGDRTAADGRLLKVIDMSVDESVLTGESTPVGKSTGALSVETAVAERKNMVFMGTYVTYGRGSAVATSTGMDTQFGKIAEMMQTVEKEEIPLKLKLDRFARRLGIATAVVSITILLLDLIRIGRIEKEMLLASVALTVSAVPEGLPAIVTVTLALGARELAKRNAVVRRLASVET